MSDKPLTELEQAIEAEKAIKATIHMWKDREQQGHRELAELRQLEQQAFDDFSVDGLASITARMNALTHLTNWAAKKAAALERYDLDRAQRKVLDIRTRTAMLDKDIEELGALLQSSQFNYAIERAVSQVQTVKAKMAGDQRAIDKAEGKVTGLKHRQRESQARLEELRALRAQLAPAGG